MVMLRELGALVSRAHGNITRLPIPTGFGFGTGGTSQIGRPGQQVAMLETYGRVGTLFSVISRITEGVATPDWHLYRKGATAEDRVQMPDDHPMMMLWNDINPFTDRFGFLEASQQHFELVGEMWWVILRAGNGMPAELQLIRPDRMFPVPDREHFIKGYVYRAGSEMVPLDIEDVILMKRPSPLDPYRGIGVVQSILVDLGAEEQAALYNRNFFLNDATPGGIIELDKSVSDAEFEKLRRHWNDQHRGVANAHRVAIIEKANWKSSHITQREMQFKDLRGISQEIIMTAFGIPRALLGISESVNRANAEVAELTFARWLVVPRLRRIKRAVNKNLVEPVLGLGFELDFDDPTPDDHEFDRETAFEGFTNKVLTKNEARELIGYSEVEGGDEFEAEPDPQPFGSFGPMGPGAGDPPQPPEIEDPEGKAVALNPTTHKLNMDAIGQRLLAYGKAELKGARLDLAEFNIMRGWVRRLDEQKAELLAFLGQFDDGIERNATLHQTAMADPNNESAHNAWIEQKLEAGDLDGFNWDWWARYGDDVTAELHEAFAASLAESFPALDMFAVERLAAEYASARGAQLLRLDGDMNIAAATRARVNSLVAGTLERGDSLGQLQKALREDVCFSRSRARTVARTETATAQGQGGMEAAKAQAMTEKSWVTQGDDRVDTQDCEGNEKQGWIKISSPFQSGHDMVPAHPNCRCTTLYRGGDPEIDPFEDLDEDIAEAIEGSRLEEGFFIVDLAGREPGAPIQGRVCPTCSRLAMIKNRDGDGWWCRKCQKVVA